MNKLLGGPCKNYVQANGSNALFRPNISSENPRRGIPGTYQWTFGFHSFE
jgi:hypothetical protein